MVIGREKGTENVMKIRLWVVVVVVLLYNTYVVLRVSSVAPIQYLYVIMNS